MRNLSTELKVWKDSQSRLIPLITLYEIEVSDSEVLRLVEGDPSGTGSVTFGGNTYTACAIRRGEHDENVEGDFPSFPLVVSNINGVAGGYIEQGDLDERQVTIRTGLLRGVEADYLVETYTIVNATYNRRQATLNLGPPNFFKEPTGRRKYVRLRCQHPWAQRFLDDAGCGYPSDVFGPDTQQELGVNAKTNGEQQRKFGWWTLNALKCRVLDKGGFLGVGIPYPGVFTIRTWAEDVEWEPGLLNAPFMFKKLSGDFEVFTQVLTEDVRAGWYAGILCQSVEVPESWVYLGKAISESRDAYICASGAEGGVIKTPIVYATEEHSWVRLVRSGYDFACYYGADGVTWTSLGALTVSMSSPIRLGLCLSAPRLEKGAIEASFSTFQFRAGGDAACERTREVCSAKGNVHRYFGFPGIPTRR